MNLDPKRIVLNLDVIQTVFRGANWRGRGVQRHGDLVPFVRGIKDLTRREKETFYGIIFDLVASYHSVPMFSGQFESHWEASNIPKQMDVICYLQCPIWIPNSQMPQKHLFISREGTSSK